MPPDTTHIPDLLNQLQVKDSLVDSFELKQVLLREANQRRLDSLGEILMEARNDGRPEYPFPEWAMFLFLLLFLAFTAYRYIFKPMRDANIRKIAKYQLDKESRVHTNQRYDNWLKKFNPYYGSLSPALRERFIERSQEFLLDKEFRFHSMTEEEYIPVLISAAAVQMTFGLKNYKLDHFPIIHVIPKPYVRHADNESYDGHVTRTAIYISWESFLDGYSDYEDAVNVGLHEMAHAVTFDQLFGDQDSHDREFKERFADFARGGNKILKSMRKGEEHIFDDHASVNFNEFWAVCIENFFENSTEFQSTQPKLYHSLCLLLNQDLLQPGVIIDEALAGV